jgi:hypothetical protein
MTKKYHIPRPRDAKTIEAPGDCTCFYGEVRIGKDTGKGRLVKSHDDWCPAYKRLLTIKSIEAERVAVECELQLPLPDPVTEQYADETRSKARKKADRYAKRLAKLG